MNAYSGKNFNQVYLSLISAILQSRQKVQDRTVLRNSIICIENPGEVFSPESHPFTFNYLNRQLDLQFSGDRDSTKFQKISKIWEDRKNPDDTINSNYGYCIFHRPIQTKFRKYEKPVGVLQKHAPEQQGYDRCNDVCCRSG